MVNGILPPVLPAEPVRSAFAGHGQRPLTTLYTPPSPHRPLELRRAAGGRPRQGDRHDSPPGAGMPPGIEFGWRRHGEAVAVGRFGPPGLWITATGNLRLPARFRRTVGIRPADRILLHRPPHCRRRGRDHRAPGATGRRARGLGAIACARRSPRNPPDGNRHDRIDRDRRVLAVVHRPPVTGRHRRRPAQRGMAVATDRRRLHGTIHRRTAHTRTLQHPPRRRREPRNSLHNRASAHDTRCSTDPGSIAGHSKTAAACTRHPLLPSSAIGAR